MGTLSPMFDFGIYSRLRGFYPERRRCKAADLEKTPLVKKINCRKGLHS